MDEDNLDLLLDGPANSEETNEDGSGDEGKDPEEIPGDDGDEGEGERTEGKEAEDDDADGDDEETPEVDVELDEAAPVNLVLLNKKYPNFFKDFPGARNAFIREQQFTNIYATVEEAEEAYQTAEAFRNFQAELSTGQSENLLKNIHRLSPKAFDKFSSNILESVQKVNPEAHNKILASVVGRAVRHVFSEAERHRNEDLARSARWFAKFFFDTEEPKQIPDPNAPQKNDELEEERMRISRERNQLLDERKAVAHDEIAKQLNTKLTEMIEDGLDPQSRLSPFAKKALVDRIIDDLDKALANDKRHAHNMQVMWQRAAKSGFSAEWRNRIRNQVIAAAERLIPTYRQKHKAQALKELGGGKANTNKLPAGKAAQNRGSGQRTSSGKKLVDYSKTSDADIFAGNLKFR